MTESGPLVPTLGPATPTAQPRLPLSSNATPADIEYPKCSRCHRLNAFTAVWKKQPASSSAVAPAAFAVPGRRVSSSCFLRMTLATCPRDGLVPSPGRGSQAS